MTSLSAVAFFAIFGVAFAGITKFTTKFDNVDIDQILGNERLFNNYYNCLMDHGKCTPDGTELKKSIPTALKEECAGCNDRQKELTERTIKFIHANHYDKWEKLVNHYDPTDVYRTKHAEFAKKHGITV